jgi:intracellular septation protein
VSENQRKWLRYGVDFSAPLAFIVVYFAGGRDFMRATAVLIAVAALAVVIGLVVERRMAWLPLFVGVSTALFGALTLFFNEKWILQNRPTVMNTFIGAVLLIGLAMKRNPGRAILGYAIPLPDEAWRKLSFRYGVWSLVLAAANFLVWKTQTEATWVTWDTIGIRILSAVFGMAQVPLLMKYMGAEEIPPPPELE